MLNLLQILPSTQPPGTPLTTHLGLLILLISMLVATSAIADKKPEAAIAERLQQWTEAFNSRDTESVCDIYALNLVATTPLAAEASRSEICAHLTALLSNPNLQLHYKLSIQEIQVRGNLAVVRLMWQLNSTGGGKTETTDEAGMDIFQRQADGRWAIIRFMSFPLTGKP